MTDAIDQALTSERSELKYRVPLRSARAIAKVVDARLTVHRFTGEGANHLPQARHFVTTVYFDTATLDLLARARASDTSLKVRAKEYYDQHLMLTQLAKSRGDLFRASPILWVEIKDSSPGRSGKRRVAIPKREVGSFFARGEISPAMIEIQRREHGDDGDETLDALRSLCERYGSSLRPTVLVNYRRSAWQGDDAGVRVTIDRDLAYFAATEGMWDCAPSLERSNLGEAIEVDPVCVVEVKCLGPMPQWLADLMAAQAGAPDRFSKFVAANDALLRASAHPVRLAAP